VPRPMFSLSKKSPMICAFSHLIDSRGLAVGPGGMRVRWPQPTRDNNGAPPVPVGALAFCGVSLGHRRHRVRNEKERQMGPVSRADRQSRGVASPGIGVELRATLALAAPLAAANLAQTAMAVTNTVMVGRLGAAPLAATGLGGVLYFTGGVMLQGVLSAVAPLAAHALGGGDRRAAGRVAGAGLLLALLLALPFAVALVGMERLLRTLGYDAALVGEIGRYLRALAWGAPAFLGFAVLRSLLAALAHTGAVMAVLFLCVAGNAALNWVMIFGHLGAPALGAAGSGLATRSING
jgi:Na+-driven multidrug efflux pump